MKALFTATLLLLGLAQAAAAGTAEGPWRPSSTTSVSITGPIVLTPSRLSAAGADFPLRLVAEPRGFRSEQGADDFGVIRSLLSTAKKQGWDLLSTLTTDPQRLIATLRLG